MMIFCGSWQRLRRHGFIAGISLVPVMAVMMVFLHFQDEESDGLPDIEYEHAGDPVIGAVAQRYGSRVFSDFLQIERAAKAAKLPTRDLLIKRCASGDVGAAALGRQYLASAGSTCWADFQASREALAAMPEFRPADTPAFDFPCGLLQLTALEVACLQAEGDGDRARQLWDATLHSVFRMVPRMREWEEWIFLTAYSYGKPEPLDLPLLLASRGASRSEALLWLDHLGKPFDFETPARRGIRNAVCLYGEGFRTTRSAKAGVAAWRNLAPALAWDWREPDSWVLQARMRWMAANTLPNATLRLLREHHRSADSLVMLPYRKHSPSDDDLPAFRYLDWNYGGATAARSALGNADMVLHRYHHAETRQRLRFTGAAILRHALRTGAFPKTLAEFELPAPLALDSYSGAPLKLDAVAHRLWSVGENLRDDGGVADQDQVLELGTPPWFTPQSK